MSRGAEGGDELLHALLRDGQADGALWIVDPAFCERQSASAGAVGGAQDL